MRTPGMLALDGPATSNLPPLLSPQMKPLVDLLQDANIRKIGHNLKHDYLALRRAKIDLLAIEFDTMVASYVMDPGRRDHTIDALAMQHFDYRTTTYDELCGKGKDLKPIAECAVEKVKEYACEDVDIAISLEQKLRVDLETQDLEKLYRAIELPLIHVLGAMEWAGIGIDFEFFKRFAR